MFSCSESEQKQLNTWVSFQSAEQPLMGHFSVSGNTLLAQRCILGRPRLNPLTRMPCFTNSPDNVRGNYSNSALPAA
ncbi:hypothetical protein GE543_09905 [Pseudomonas sp. SZ57]|nr:hypothetical protein [Pseudomonas sp. SZ57]